MLNCHFINLFCLLKFTENNKKKVRYELDCYLISHFDMNGSIFVFMCLYPCICLVSCFKYVWYALIKKIE